jgi:hypothetical protein
VFEQYRTLDCEHSINGFHKQINLVERTWNDDLRAMSYGLGIAIVVLVSLQEWASSCFERQQSLKVLSGFSLPSYDERLDSICNAALLNAAFPLTFR